MRNAPPVHVLCQGHAWRRAQAFVFGLAAAALVLWAVQHLGVLRLRGLAWPAWAPGLAAAVVGVTAAALAAWLLRAPAAELRWDGQQWWLGANTCVPDLMLQGGSGLLLRLRPGAGSEAAPTWLAVTTAEAGTAWHGLLVALRAQPRADSASSQGWAL